MDPDLMAPIAEAQARNGRTLPASTLFHRLGSAIKARTTAEAEIVETVLTKGVSVEARRNAREPEPTRN